MKFRSIALAVAALSVAASPAIAQASLERAVAPLEDVNEATGGDGILIGVLAAAAIIGGVFIASSGDQNDEDLPFST